MRFLYCLNNKAISINILKKISFNSIKLLLNQLHLKKHYINLTVFRYNQKKVF